MRFQARFIAAFVVSLAFFGGVSAARAEAPKFFEMSDGRYYDPATGLTAESKGALMKLIEAPAQDLTVVETPPVQPADEATSTPALSEPAMGGLQNAIAQARALLQERIDADAKKKPVVVTNQNVWVDVTLAVWDARTDALQLIDVRKNGTGLKLDPATPDDTDVVVKRNNGVNSTFAVDDGERVVVAVRYPIFKDISVSKRKPKYELHDVVYTPYSDALHTAEMVAAGKSTLRNEIGAAYDALRASGAKSRAFPSQLMVDVIDPHLVESIAIIEHDGLGALTSEDPTAVEAFYVTLAGNQGDAYVYARSSAGALGLVQFIPSTYALMVKHKELHLNPDFTRGMTDPVNAIKAQIGYLDSILASMPTGVKDLYNVDPSRVDEYLAASYNTGESRVRKAIALWGDAWSEPHPAEIAALAKKKGARSKAVKTMKNSTLLPETVTYVKKLRQALKLLSPPELPTA